MVKLILFSVNILSSKYRENDFFQISKKGVSNHFSKKVSIHDL